jgi:arylformamidase
MSAAIPPGRISPGSRSSDWGRDFDLPPDVIKSALLCSGMYDLKPLRLSARSNYVKFTDEKVLAGI